MNRKNKELNLMTKGTKCQRKGKKAALSFTFSSSNRRITGTTPGRTMMSKRGTLLEGD
jgi:hypothetical protein